MKFIAFALFILAPMTYAQTDCTKALDDVKLMCGSAQDACDDVKECLVRRDTCVDSIPKNERDCNALDSCMQGYKSQFAEGSRCDYTWAIPSSGDGFCRVKKHFLFSEEACPGRTHGLLNAFAYGLSSTVDKDFNCASVVRKRAEKVESCDDKLNAAKNICGSIPQTYQNFKATSCTEAARFSTYRNREFALESSQSSRVNDISRRNSSGSGASGSSSSQPASSTGR